MDNKVPDIENLLSRKIKIYFGHLLSVKLAVL